VLFTELTMANGRTVEREVYPRSDETVYICGAGNEPDDTPLPERADQVLPNPESIQRLKDAAEFISPGTFTHAEVVVEQSCYRPNSHTGLPVIGKVRQG
jgi:glycine/D-amino acid oxidase-like deaminating enzyme